jgi:hypothetical protein
MISLEEIKSFGKAVNSFLSKDPKAIFDHVRNVGIAGAMILGAGLLRDMVEAEQQPLTSYIPVVILLIGGVLLLVMNLIYAQRTIVKFIYGAKKSKSFIQEVRFLWRLMRYVKKLTPTRRKIVARGVFRKYLIAKVGAQWLLVLYFIIISMLIMVQFYSSSASLDSKKVEESARSQLIGKLSTALSDVVKEKQGLNEELKATQLKFASQTTVMYEKDRRINILENEVLVLQAQAQARRHHPIKKPAK